MKRSFSFGKIALVVLAVGAVSALVGGAFLLRPHIGGDANAALSIPDAGDVRVLAKRIETTPGNVHAQWTFLGSANWKTATATGTELSLADTYPLNSTEQRGGCHTYYADLEADTTTGKWTLLLHGSFGNTVRTEGALPSGKAVSDVVQLAQNEPAATLSTPTTITLARIDGVPLRIAVAR